MKCPKCNKKVYKDDIFCHRCGCRLDQINNLNSNEDNPQSNKSFNGNSSNIIIVSSFVMTTVIAVIVCFLLVNNRHNGKIKGASSVEDLQVIDNDDATTLAVTEDFSEEEKTEAEATDEKPEETTEEKTDNQQYSIVDLDEKKINAMYESMVSFVRDGGYPDGSTYNQISVGNDEYALSDIDGDGRTEIVFRLSCRSVAADDFYILECNPNTGRAKLELRCYSDVDVRDDGIIIGYDSHNLGITDDDWGATIYEYDAGSDIYVNVGTTTRGETGDYYPDTLEWHSVSDSIFDIELYLNELQKNINNYKEDRDVLSDLIEYKSLYDLMYYYSGNDMYGIEQSGAFEEPYYHSVINGEEIITSEAYEGGTFIYSSEKIDGLTIAGVYPGMDSSEAYEILESIDLIRSGESSSFCTGYYGNRAYCVTLTEVNGVVSSICLSEWYYLDWKMPYDSSGYEGY